MCFVLFFCFFFFFFKQKTAYEMRISDWSSDVCSSDLFHILVIPAKVGMTEKGARWSALPKGPAPPQSANRCHRHERKIRRGVYRPWLRQRLTTRSRISGSPPVSRHRREKSGSLDAGRLSSSSVSR